MNTPWGFAQHTEKLADGIIRVDTSSHGGIRLSEERNALVHEAWRVEDRWYEEDCDWAIVALTFPEAFPADHVEYAHESAKSWHAVAYQKVFGVKLTAADSHQIAEAEFWEAHRDDFITVAAWGSWQDGVPEGMVGVCARRGGRGGYRTGPEAWFLVPDDEYEGRGTICGLAIDVARHEEVGDFTVSHPKRMVLA